VAAIVPPEVAAEIEAAEEADVAGARAALEEGGEPIPWEQVKSDRPDQLATARPTLP
jgi:hypothetical protein